MKSSKKWLEIRIAYIDKIYWLENTGMFKKCSFNFKKAQVILYTGKIIFQQKWSLANSKIIHVLTLSLVKFGHK